MVNSEASLAMDSAVLPDDPSASQPGERVLAALGIEGDLRFISHRDSMRMMVRALVRAEAPLAYSRGFNPRPKLALLLPRPVGVAAEGDPVVIHLAGSMEPPALARALNAHLPAGAHVAEVQRLPCGSTPKLLAVCSMVRVADEAAAGLTGRIAQFLAASEVHAAPMDRSGRAGRMIDLRPLVKRLEFTGGELLFETVFQGGATASPKVLLPALGLSWNELRHEIRRKKVQCQL